MGSGSGWGKWIPAQMAVVFIVFALFPYIPFIGRYLSLGTEVVIWSLFALGFNILLGYTGLPSFGHGAFFGIGAYGAGIFFLQVYKGVWLPLVVVDRSCRDFCGPGGFAGGQEEGNLFCADHHRAQPGLLLRRFPLGGIDRGRDGAFGD